MSFRCWCYQVLYKREFLHLFNDSWGDSIKDQSSKREESYYRRVANQRGTHSEANWGKPLINDKVTEMYKGEYSDLQASQINWRVQE